jgi:5-methylcytosine-specific restriction endonuclease McrA
MESLPSRSRAYRGAGTLSPLVILAVFLRDAGTCAYCGARPAKPTVDHIVPRSLGGTSEAANLCTACPSCNSRKKDKPLSVFVPNATHRARILRRARRPLNLDAARVVRAAVRAAE